jgi:gamma-glutamylcyclotransferase
MYYFAYGSNMSIARLRERVPSASLIGCHTLGAHDLRFHKASKDGSGKCDACFTDNSDDIVYGALFEMDPAQKSDLDRAEGLGSGYELKEVNVIAADGSFINATTYVATKINKNLKPYSWYVNHVLVGAKETSLPVDYIQKKIEAVEAIEDDDKERYAKEHAVHT